MSADHNHVKYIDKATYRRQRAALTRARNSGDPRRVIVTVERTVREWRDGGYAWPDDWSTWNVAYRDAVTAVAGWRAGMAAHVDNIR